MRRLFLALILAVGVHAQDAASVARLVHETAVDPAPLVKALQSSDALVRATAARVALVRGVNAAVPALRTALAAEANPEAAREEIGALVVLGNDDDVAFAASQLPRFPASIDGAFTAAIARTGAPRAIDLYLRHRGALRGTDTFSGITPHWRGDAHVVPAAARLLGAGAGDAFISLVSALTDSKRTLDSGIATAAAGSDDAKVREAVVWHLAQRAVEEPSSVPASLRERASAPRDDAPVKERVGRELLRRVGGAAPHSDQAMAEWFDKNWVHTVFTPLLTKEEQKGRQMPPAPKAAMPSTELAETSFGLPLALPRGLAGAIFASTRCKRGGWVGVATVTADHAGRVQSLDVSNVGFDPGCEDVLRTIARLALATPNRIGAGTTAPLLVVRPNDTPPCFDQSVLAAEPARPGGDVVAPKVKRRVEPNFPESARAQVKGSILVVAEMTITAEGCVRDLRLLRQTPFPELNTAALLAVAKWTFTPGTLNGVPVDVIFNITINFKVR